MRFAIYGTGGFGREVAPLVEDFYSLHEAPFKNVGGGADIVFIDDADDRPAFCNGMPVISFDELKSEMHRDRRIIVAVGNGRTRESLENRCVAAGLEVISLVASSAKVLHCTEIGVGSILCHGTIITSNIKLGKSFHANLHSYVGHDCVIGDYVTFAPRVSCNGNVHILDYAYVGTGAMFIQGKDKNPLIIGEGAFVGMGAVVTKPVEPYTVVAGNPAKLIRRLEKPFSS
jgi:sugar O-acyltransferase (sialic acid O-acetyltransferase NeuD family)